MIRKILSTLFTFIVVASIWGGSTSTAEAQDSASPKTPSSKVEDKAAARDSVTIADIQKAADQLAVAVQEAVRKATEDPAVKLAALNVAKNAVTAAQVVITQQAATLQTVLDAMAREIARATDTQQSKAKSH
jgi:hypothetical protein